MKDQHTSQKLTEQAVNYTDMYKHTTHTHTCISQQTEYTFFHLSSQVLQKSTVYSDSKELSQIYKSTNHIDHIP